MRGTGYAVLLWRIRKRARPSATARAAWTGFTTGTPSFASRADLLKDIQQESGVAYLFITHDLAVVRWISHRIEVMRSGRIVESGADRAHLRGAARGVHEGAARRRSGARPASDAPAAR